MSVVGSRYYFSRLTGSALRRVLKWTTLTYAATLILLVVSLEWWGEQLWFLSPLLYAPAPALLLPLVLLVPLAVFFRRKSLLVHAVCALLVFLVYMKFQWHSPAPHQAGEISVMTFNFGERDLSQFAAFRDQEKPDILAMQDAVEWSPNFADANKDQYVATRGEFVLVSQLPITSAELIRVKNDESRPVAARFELQRGDERFVLYSVHIPTPREKLAPMLRPKRVLNEALSPGERDVGIANYKLWLANRIELARELHARISAEHLPVIVAGDFNTPNHGVIYHTITDGLADAFDVSGFGWGYTFPGVNSNPIPQLPPWLRLDYLLVGPGWRVLECRPERGSQSQHRAVFGRFVLQRQRLPGVVATRSSDLSRPMK